MKHDKEFRNPSTPIDRTSPSSANGPDKPLKRRHLLKGSLAVGGAAASAAIGFPYIRDAAAAETTTWKVQTAWWQGVAGWPYFENWCKSIVEKTGGELAFQPFAGGAAVGTFEMMDATRTGVLDAMNWFTLYGAGKLPATVFLSSYPLGLRNPHEWDVFFYGLGGLEITRKLYAQYGLFYVGQIQHGPNIIHSKTPIRSIEDFKDKKMRVPGGMVAELFTAAGAKTTLLPGSEIYPAMEKGTIDITDVVGPAINHDMGLAQVAKFISMGPPGFMSIYQPVDLMDLTVNMDRWNALSPQMKQFVEMETQVYSNAHHAEIQRLDQIAWKKFADDNVRVIRLTQRDVEEFTKLAVPLWYKWANKDKTAAQVFKIQLDYMMSGSLGYVTPDMIKGQTLNM
jgi:TRAP-type mannitol/chloroaromatic compound transport system substrate-binding protein